MSNNLWNQDNYDPKNIREVEVSWWSSRPAIIAVGAIVAILAGLILYYALKDGSSAGHVNEVPVIEAIEGADRVRPDSPGGYEVPHQDKQIYEALTSEKSTPKAEQLLEAPEEPITPPIIVMDEVKNEDRKEDQSPTVDREQVTIKEKDFIEKPSAGKKGKAQALKAEKKSSASKSGFKAQLASLKSEAAAQKEWKMLRNRYAKELKGVTMSIDRVSLSKGTFYRLHVGPFKSKTEAKSFCKRLNTKGGHCIA